MVAVETPLKQGWNKPMFLMNFLGFKFLFALVFSRFLKIIYIFF